MDSLLIVFAVFVIVFLAVVAAVYIIRPEVLMDGDPAHPDVDMWLAFMFAILVSLLTVAVAWMVCSV